MSNNNQGSQKEGFSSIGAFLLVVIGFSVGVGSLWRFPYVCGTNGGALFLLVYLLVILIIGVPLLTAEISIGYKTQKTATNAYKELAPGKKWYLASYLHIAAGLLILSYTIPIYCWILIYIFRTATGFFSGMSPEQIGTSFENLNVNYRLMFTAAIVEWSMLWLVVSRGLQGGVERLNKILLPSLAIIMAICIAIGFTIEGSSKGVEFLLTPNFETFSFNTVMTAVGQAFYAIGIAMLGAMVFGSYIKNKNENIMKDSFFVCMAIVIAGLAAGFMIFPMVFAFGLEPSAGPGLTMITLPNVFNSIPAGNLIGCLFYIGFFFAAFTSVVGVAEAVVAVLMENGNMSRKKALAYTIGVAVVVGSLSILSAKAFNIMDIITSNIILIIGGLIISIFVGWVWGLKDFFEAISMKNRLGQIWLGVSIKYICPVLLTIVFIGKIVEIIGKLQ